MYKKAAQFSQRATRSDYRLKDRLKAFDEKAKPKRKKRKGSVRANSLEASEAGP